MYGAGLNTKFGMEVYVPSYHSLRSLEASKISSRGNSLKTFSAKHRLERSWLSVLPESDTSKGREYETADL